MRASRFLIWGVLALLLMLAAGLVGTVGAQTARMPDAASLEEAVLGRLDAAQVLVVESAIEGQWAAGGLVQVRDGQLVGGEGTVFVARWDGVAWQVIVEGTSEFRAILPQVPATLLAANEKERLDYESVDREAPLNSPAQPQASGYKLPWPAGVSYRLSGAWATGSCPHGIPPNTSHAIDVGMPIGSRIVAAKDGIVYLVRETSNACGCSSSVPGNWVAVRHEPDDGLTDWYIHLAPGGAEVSVGQRVKQGETIGYSHQIGYTCGGSSCAPGTCAVPNCSSFPHLHFHVENKSRQRVYITFDDAGAIVGCTRYTSGNSGTPDPTPSPTPEPDTEPPTPPGNLRPNCGDWFGSFTSTPRPCFTWDASTDASGVRGYHAAIDDASPDGEGTNDDWVGPETSWTVLNNVGEGARFLRVAAEEDTDDRLRSYSEPLTFTLDTRVPDYPTYVHAGCTGQNNVWQNECRNPVFVWDGASDGGSGVKDYHYYWGPLELGVPSAYTTGTTYDPGPVAAEDGCAVVYLNLAVRDNLLQESAAGPAFVLRYDGDLPSAGLLIHGGAVTVTQMTVKLDITADDACSQVTAVRLSNNGLDWSEWTPFQESLQWHVPPLDRTTFTVYLQVRDAAGNESAVVEDSAYLDLYPRQPRSASYLLCATTLDAGGQVRASASYSVTDAIGEPGAETGAISYTLASGLLATVGGCPVTAPLSLPITLTHSLIASGGGLQGATDFRLGGSNGQVPAGGAGSLTSASYQVASGFWGGVGRAVPAVPVQRDVTPRPLPPALPASPDPPPEDGSFGVWTGELSLGFTNRVTTALSLWAPGAVELQVDLAPDFSMSSWQPFTTPLTWYYAPQPGLAEGTQFYARFRDAVGTVYGAYETTLFYDGLAPTVTFELVGVQNGQAILALEANDDYAGVHEQRVGDSADLLDAPWQPYSETLTVDVIAGVPIYLQVRDRAGNRSDPVVIYAAGAYATYLPVVLRNH